MATPHGASDAADALPGRRMPRVLRQFLATEAAGGIVLLAAAAVAMVWANSPWSGSYDTLWETELSIGLGTWDLTLDLRHWVNEGLMALFFLVVGLEIKRELVHGDLHDPRTAALPVVAAVGGMAVPALVFLAFTAGTEAARGWGIPMATDIAFAMGVVALVGSRAPSSLKLFLLTLAIVDDIGAIVVIALAYAEDVEPLLVLAAAALLVAIVALRRVDVVWAPPFALLGVAAWLVTHASGVHATIAGVALGLLVPASRLAGTEAARRWAGELSDEPSPAELEVMRRLAASTVSQAERLEHLLHPWTSFVVVPVFALANAGVELDASAFDRPVALRIALGAAVGLVGGKLLGILGASWLAVRTGAGRLPPGATWHSTTGIAAVGGIGFTVSLFIAELAFEPGTLQDAAKLGVLAASAVAAAVGSLILTRSAPAPAPPEEG